MRKDELEQALEEANATNANLVNKVEVTGLRLKTALEDVDKLTNEAIMAQETLGNSRAIVAARIATLEPRFVHTGFKPPMNNRADDPNPASGLHEVKQELKLFLHLRDVLEGQGRNLRCDESPMGFAQY